VINELRKFYKNTAVVIVFCLAIILSICMPFLFIYNYETCDYSNGKEVIVSGLKAFKYEKEHLKNVSGILTTDKLNEVLDFYRAKKNSNNGDDGDLNIEYKYPQMVSIITQAYTPFGGKTIDVSKIDNANDFYSKNVQRVKEKIELTYDKSISSKEKQEALNKASNIEGPYNLEFMNQWPILIKSLLFVYIVIVLSAILISSGLFSFEKENNMDIILNSAGKRKLIRVGFNKIFALLSYLTVEFLICTSITSLIIFALIGKSGWDSQIQLLSQFITVIYNWTIGKMFIWYLIIAWISILSIAAIGSLINAIFQELYSSSIIMLILMITPIFLRDSSLFTIGLKKFIYIQPINGISLLHFIDNLFIYNVGSFEMLSAHMILIVSLVYLFIGIIFSPIVFSKRIGKQLINR